MERIKELRSAILEVMEEYATERQNALQGISFESIVDAKNFRYQLLMLGWQGEERIHSLLFHVDIIKGKIWIQEDNTEQGVANLLTAKGISKDDIVLAYFSEFHRQFTGFAVA